MSTILFRRDHLAMTKNFWCSCSRCCDSTEFGSNISTIFDRWLLLSLSFKKYPLSSNQASPFQPLSCVTDNIQSKAGNQCCQKIHWTHRLTGFARRQVRWKTFELWNLAYLRYYMLSSNVTYDFKTGMRRNAMEVKTQLSKIGQELEIMMNKVISLKAFQFILNLNT